jgi:hypothetical protein
MHLPANRILLATGAALIVLAVDATLTKQGVLAGGVALPGLVAVLFSPLAPRMEGPVDVSLTGFTFTLVKAVIETGWGSGAFVSHPLRTVRQCPGVAATTEAPARRTATSAGRRPSPRPGR